MKFERIMYSTDFEVLNTAISFSKTWYEENITSKTVSVRRVIKHFYTVDVLMQNQTGNVTS
jgi:hypothetical protein